MSKYNEQEVRLIVADAKRLYGFRKDSAPRERVDFEGVLEEAIRRNGRYPSNFLKDLVRDEWRRQKEERDKAQGKQPRWDKRPVWMKFRR